MISFRTLGTSEKKNKAKMPATAPKEPAVMPLRIGKLVSLRIMFACPWGWEEDEEEKRKEVQSHGGFHADAVEVRLHFVTGGGMGC